MNIGWISEEPSNTSLMNFHHTYLQKRLCWTSGKHHYLKKTKQKALERLLQSRSSYNCDVQGQTCEELYCRAPGALYIKKKQNPKSKANQNSTFVYNTKDYSDSPLPGLMQVPEVIFVQHISVADKDAFSAKSDRVCPYLCLLPPSFPRAFLLISHLRDYRAAADILLIDNGSQRSLVPRSPAARMNSAVCDQRSRAALWVCTTHGSSRTGERPEGRAMEGGDDQLQLLRQPTEWGESHLTCL